MKFGKEFAAQMVPEWQQVYMDYGMLKNVLKEIQRFKQQKNRPSPGSGGLKRKMTMYRAFSGLTRRCIDGGGGGGEADEQAVILVNAVDQGGAGYHQYETMFLKSSEEGGELEIVFFRRLDDEFNKVNSFYKHKVDETLAEADDLTKQMNALIAFRLRVENPRHYHSIPTSPPTSPPISPNTAEVQTPLGKKFGRFPLFSLDLSPSSSGPDEPCFSFVFQL